ncbi:hypothetical protein GLOIN_2v1639645 [Rhizophagus irregularis DAOM 181602=DAOM 197198]|uniref:Crinkler effector protein N-terminal domain-containing protein n=1 Tax=Rhizophagus irregularis (strain DAOM 181602 / DAOM 197198 / MUCL 43194) TaxID=747089 RepID=A0A2P4PRX3_RHIID|nr:hypothetical protein GLOIN_2v1639645 [Rhizophagus irregularis DAOM 181602=DAOM 197198]POG68145.1 hypothetical protein GLOIN_2v1639645 [Rhizophagus irregularis DAOM 181602=DAOM 197198]|eukprot:XP_025175011.1 hypothetical protein GLOIN_2v1639645 [Rhizophagus irregularis DAOM 181602=DAOM 197198]
MPPKKAPIYCLVNGDPENSVFGIKYDKNTTVDELKEIIYTKKKNAFADIDYPDLTLYKVNINLNTDNPNEPLSPLQIPPLWVILVVRC